MDARRVAVGALLVSACGRFGFTELTDHDAATSPMLDDSGDATGSTDAFVACSAAFALCDGFDMPTLDTSLWTVGGDVSIDPTIAHRGASSVRMRVPALAPNQGFGSYIEHVGPLISTASVLWVRAWVRLGALPAATNALEMVSVQQSGGVGDFVFIRSNDTELYNQFDTANSAAGVPPPVNTWFCLVWELRLSTSTATALSSLTSDVIPPVSITNSPTQGTPPVDTAFFGPIFAFNNVDVAQPAFDVWIDDVIIHPTMLTCAD